MHGRDALERVYQHCPDVILTDLMMPVMDGWTFIWECRRAPARGLVPILVMSAHFHFPESVSKLEVRACIAKPFDLDVMLDVLGRVLQTGSDAVTAHRQLRSRQAIRSRR